MRLATITNWAYAKVAIKTVRGVTSSFDKLGLFS
jgi:hypothetical protein